MKKAKRSSVPSPKYFLIALAVIVATFVAFTSVNTAINNYDRYYSVKIWSESEREDYFELCTNPPQDLAKKAYGVDLDLPGITKEHCGCMLDGLQEEFPSREDYQYSGDSDSDLGIAERTGRIIGRCLKDSLETPI